jgi:deoxyadenosine/deoxycytidine kinase
MQRLIIITGDLAAGKSTLAAAISDSLGIPYIIKDALKEIACDNIGYQTRQENRQLSITATQDMIYFFKQCGLVCNDLILEANFRTEELLEIKGIADEYNYNVVLLILTGDIPLLYQRFLDRLPNRHIAHRSMNLDYSLERFADYINELRDQDFVFTPNYLDMSNLDEDEVTEEALQIINDELGN